MVLTHVFVLKYFGITSVGIFPFQLPHVKEWLPVDVWHDAVEVIIEECGHTKPEWSNYKEKQSSDVNLK